METEERSKPERVPAPNRRLKELARGQGLFALDVTEFDQAIEYFVLGHLMPNVPGDRKKLDNLVKALEPYGVQRDNVQIERTKYGGVYATRLFCPKQNTVPAADTEAEAETETEKQEEHHVEQPAGNSDRGTADDQHSGC